MTSVYLYSAALSLHVNNAVLRDDWLSVHVVYSFMQMSKMAYLVETSKMFKYSHAWHVQINELRASVQQTSDTMLCCGLCTRVLLYSCVKDHDIFTYNPGPTRAALINYIFPVAN